MADRKIVELLKRYVVLLKSEWISVNKAYLFGRYSAGIATGQSDSLSPLVYSVKGNGIEIA